MNKHTDTELHTIKTQLKDIRSAMNVSGSTFSLIYSANNFRRMFILSGIFSLLFPLLYQVLLWAYLTPAEIPLLLRIVFYACIFICWCILLVVRTKASIRMAKTMGLPSNVWELVKQLLATRMWLAIVPAILLLIALPIKYAQAFEPLDYVPYFGIVLGLMLNMIGVMIRERNTAYAAHG